MSVELRADVIPATDRVEVIHEAVCRGVLPVDIAWADEAPDIELAFRLAVAGPLNVSSATSSGSSLTRTSRQARADHPPHVFVALQVSGRTIVTQGSRETVLGPGDMTVYETTRPYAVHNVGPTSLHYFQVPRSALAVSDHALAASCASRIAADTNPLASVVAPFLAAVAGSEALDDPRAATIVAPPVIELMRSLLSAQVLDSDTPLAPSGRALVVSAQRFIHDHLGERDLGPARIAAAHHVSLRLLYAEFARAGVSLHDTIRDQRLAACLRDLRDPACSHLAVATIGARWGFVDPSHFGRVFKAAHGTTPYEWRRAGRPTA